MKIELDIYSNKTSLELFHAANTPTRVKRYLENDFSFLSEYESIKVLSEVISCLPNLFYMGNNKLNKDSENAVQLYDSFGSLKIDFSLDPRFWIHLTHNFYQDYTYKRWIKGNNQANDGTVTDRFFGFYKRGTDRSIARNAIARLWWGAKMTVKDGPGELDYYFNSIGEKYKYTRLLFSAQDVHQQLSERTFGRSKKIILSILHYMYENDIKFDKKNIIRISKLVSLHMYNNRLAVLKPSEINDYYKIIIGYANND